MTDRITTHHVNGSTEHELEQIKNLLTVDVSDPDVRAGRVDFVSIPDALLRLNGALVRIADSLEVIATAQVEPETLTS